MDKIKLYNPNNNHIVEVDHVDAKEIMKHNNYTTVPGGGNPLFKQQEQVGKNNPMLENKGLRKPVKLNKAKK